MTQDGDGDGQIAIGSPSRLQVKRAFRECINLETVLDGKMTNMSKALGSQQLEIGTYDPIFRHSCVASKVFLPISFDCS